MAHSRWRQLLSNNVPFWSVLAYIFETSRWNNITFGSQGYIGIIRSFSDSDLGMTPRDLELFLGGWPSAGKPFLRPKTSGAKVGYCRLLGASYSV